MPDLNKQTLLTLAIKQQYIYIMVVIPYCYFKC